MVFLVIRGRLVWRSMHTQVLPSAHDGPHLAGKTAVTAAIDCGWEKECDPGVLKATATTGLSEDSCCESVTSRRAAQGVSP